MPEDYKITFIKTREENEFLLRCQNSNVITYLWRGGPYKNHHVEEYLRYYGVPERKILDFIKGNGKKFSFDFFSEKEKKNIIYWYRYEEFFPYLY